MGEKKDHVVSCRISIEEFAAFKSHLNRLGLADVAPFVKRLLLKEISGADSFSLLDKEIELLDRFALRHGKISRRDAILKLLTQEEAKPSTSSNEIKEVKDEVTKLRKQFINTIMLAMTDITHNINQTLGPNDSAGLTWEFVEKRITTLLNEMEKS